jgi:hypothetical protein
LRRLRRLLSCWARWLLPALPAASRCLPRWLSRWPRWPRWVPLSVLLRSAAWRWPRLLSCRARRLLSVPLPAAAAVLAAPAAASRWPPPLLSCWARCLLSCRVPRPLSMPLPAAWRCLPR